MTSENELSSQPYRGYTIRISPYEDRCSNFAVAVLDPKGVEFKHQRQAGKTEEHAFAYGRRIVDWEIGYAEQKAKEHERRKRLDAHRLRTATFTEEKG